jgi:hypothetical protein
MFYMVDRRKIRCTIFSRNSQKPGKGSAQPSPIEGFCFDAFYTSEHTLTFLHIYTHYLILARITTFASAANFSAAALLAAALFAIAFSAAALASASAFAFASAAALASAAAFDMPPKVSHNRSYTT